MNISRHHDEWVDLLVQESTDGLSVEQRAQLEEWLLTQPDAAEQMAATVAALTLAAEADSTTRSPAMPAELSARILAAAPTATATSSPQIASPRFAAAGWWAAAASLLLAVVGWWPRLVNPPSAGPLPYDQQRSALLKSVQTIHADWSPGTDPAANAIQGDVVFDPISQRGYLRFKGIPANDPRLAQYQLWIADAKRSQPQPVDGGVFDVRAATTTDQGDVIIPFTAKLPVGQPAAFVVTIEQPGGVVVSSQERVLALAKISVQ